MGEEKLSNQNEEAKTSRYECGICQEKFASINYLEIHIRTELKEKPFTCHLCSQTFYVFNEYVNHGKDKHDLKNFKYKCRKCSWESSDNNEFQLHEACHIPEFRPFDCIKCGEAFFLLSQLLGHKRLYCGEKSYPCEQCDRMFTRTEDVYLHMRTHKNLPAYECVFCSKLFATPKNFGVHVINNHKNEITLQQLVLIEMGVENNDANFIESLRGTSCFEKKIDLEERWEPSQLTIALMKKFNLVKNYKCPLCKLNFVRLKTLEIHCELNHKNINVSEQLESIRKKVKAESNLKTNHEKNMIQNCSACKKDYLNEEELITHIFENHYGAQPYKCCTCKLRFSRPSTIVEHVKVHSELRVKCIYCPKTFINQSSLGTHLKKHEGKDPHHCPICNIPYTERNSLERHMRIHSKGKPHKCDFCERRFAQSCDRQKHMRMHTGEKPYKCEECKKSFAHLTSFKKHQIIHSGVKDFQCTTCGKAFNHKSNLIVHSRIHTGERPYICDICQKSFYTSGHLAEHNKIHTQEKGFECEVCQKRFRHKSSYDKHKRIHSGERPYVCQVCRKNFLQQSHLTGHMRIHTDEKPYKCEVCSKDFRRSDALRTHMKIHKRKLSIDKNSTLNPPKKCKSSGTESIDQECSFETKCI